MRPDCGLSSAGPGVSSFRATRGDFLEALTAATLSDRSRNSQDRVVTRRCGFWARRCLGITTEVRIPQMTSGCQERFGLEGEADSHLFAEGAKRWGTGRTRIPRKFSQSQRAN